MRCPGDVSMLHDACGAKLGKLRLDAYHCPVCGKEWLIKRLTRGRRQLKI